MKKIVVALCFLIAACANFENVNWRTATVKQVEALIKTGADVKERDKDGLTVLMHAAWKNENPAVIEALINAGADVKARDIEGRTVFDYAEKNPKIKGTPVYWKLNDLKYQ